MIAFGWASKVLACGVAGRPAGFVRRQIALWLGINGGSLRLLWEVDRLVTLGRWVRFGLCVEGRPASDFG